MDGNAVGRLIELFIMYGSGKLNGVAPLLAFCVAGRWRALSRGQAIQCLGSGLADVGGMWRDEGRGFMAALITEGFALNSG